MNSAKKLYISSVSVALLAAFMCRMAPVFGISEMTIKASDVIFDTDTVDTGSSNDTPPSAPMVFYAKSDTFQKSVQLFSDVTDADWFYLDVKTLCDAGIVNGYPDGYFHPEREISNAEFIKILICTDPTAKSISATTLFPTHWASKYITAAHERGIINDIDLRTGFNPDSPVTRSSMTKMMILALGIEPARIDDPFTDISDMYASTAYNEYLLRGYLLEDGSRVYKGAGNAMRSEASAIAVRVMEYRADSYSYKRDAILENASKNPLNNEFELINLFYILNREFITEFTFETKFPVEVWTEYYRHSNLINLEYFYNSSYSFRTGSEIYTIKLEYSSDIEQLKRLHSDSEEKADRIINSIITADMSDYDKVKAIHDYLILNCEYDYANYLTGTLPFETRLAYGALCNRIAVCQGYTAAFNMLCKRAGIRTAAIGGFAPNSKDSHSWNMVLLDGQIYYVDVTHDDPVPDLKGKITYRYFCLTESEMSSLGYSWVKSYSNIKYLY